MTAICVALAIGLSRYFGECSEIPKTWPEEFKGVRFNCQEGEHNDVATLFLSIPDDLLKRLFSIGRDKITDAREASGFRTPALLIFSCAPSYSSGSQ